MKRVLLVLGAVLLIAAFGAVVFLNPGEVEFHPTHVHSFHPMLGLLLIFTFAAGALVTVLGSSIRSVTGTLAGWRHRRSARAAAQSGEWHQTGEQLAWGGELERSRALLKKAWKRHPRNTAAALALASSYVDTGEYGEAQTVLDAAVAADPHDPDVRYALGETLRRRGDTADAIRMLETVRVHHPRAPRVLLSLRELYGDAGRWTEAAAIQDVYVQTLPAEARPPEIERLVRLRYQAACTVADPQERIAALDAVVQRDRTFVPALVSLGDALLAQGRGDEAERLWEKAFKLQPRAVFIERLLARNGSGSPPRAAALISKYRDQLDADSAHLLLARVALAGDDVDRAAAELDALANRDTPRAQRLSAEVLHRRGEHARAWDALRRAADARAYHCAACGAAADDWTGYCHACSRWDTYREQ
jgi:tetratricopeptide (TPR) repeat protein